MAKKSSGPNKSLEIRNYLGKNPNAKPREIVDAMKAKGIEVSAQFVSTVKSTSKKTGSAPRKPGRPAGTTKAATATRRPAASSTGDKISVDSLIRLKAVVEELGIEETRVALSTLEKLSK
ncbi:hypothetical protein [Roseiconus lacunae]|uniref:Uncharacterized protein n=1 Tax=Roseiconus lacunae TaxID=2605694 RepID=A0ABT7PCV1_9BACT|nr:hypothetical protein [Roseiconus lacunae]MCD0459603.1 hypothetical protein [Roseiconus lacunae]MDM4014301.1 hypothetical protein [Roseiconus lacunae]WRQ49619.1 hypothetical protein U8335_22005 [Stieleria sp. HD01]